MFQALLDKDLPNSSFYSFIQKPVTIVEPYGNLSNYYQDDFGWTDTLSSSVTGWSFQTATPSYGLNNYFNYDSSRSSTLTNRWGFQQPTSFFEFKTYSTPFFNDTLYLPLSPWNR
ncbi:MAG: hypothetical protein ACMUIP_11190 [bacterium]